jgi:hypothetical protein
LLFCLVLIKLSKYVGNTGFLSFEIDSPNRDDTRTGLVANGVNGLLPLLLGTAGWWFGAVGWFNSLFELSENLCLFGQGKELTLRERSAAKSVRVVDS